MEKLATHNGIVTATAKGHVQVQMQVLSACASCEAHAKCGFAEKQDKTVDIDTSDWQQYHVGEAVTVVISSGLGLQAVLIAYVIPSVVLLASLAIFTLLHIPEGITALLILLIVALYALSLYLFRRRLQRKFSFQIRHKEQDI